MSKLQYQNYILLFKKQSKSWEKAKGKSKGLDKRKWEDKKGKSKKEQTGGNRPLWLMKILK